LIDNKRIIHSLILLSILFLGLITYLTYFELFTKDLILNNSYNRRLRESEDKIMRGTIYDRNNVILANSVVKDSKQERKYPFSSLYSHVIGYSSSIYGKSLLEAQYNNYLLGKNSSNKVFEIKNKIVGNSLKGNDIYISIDNTLQQTASELMGENRGAIVAINPKTGEVLAIVSKPDYDPNDNILRQNWNRIVESIDHTFLSRATLGLYAPGSTYKVLISGLAIEKGLTKETYEDNGKTIIDGRIISNYGGKSYGKLTLREALTFSSNSVFSILGVLLGELAQKALFNQEIPFDLPLCQSQFPYKTMSKADLAVSAIGQGKILTTPLHMALIGAGIANNGTMMKPILITKIQNEDNIVVKSQKPSIMCHLFTPDVADILTDMMIDVVNKGTGKNAQIKSIEVAGKTGTAENELSINNKNMDHSWFIGFAPAQSPEIAIAVVLEHNGSTGGESAAPIARNVMAKWLGR
jgi:peptidoglycan glycosyltransferase